MAQYDLFEKKSNHNPIDVDAYMERIGCIREYRPTIRFLRSLHRNHMLSIPFENLDIHVGNQIILDIDRIFDKVINQKRGGFCYELNGLFYHLLEELGFQCKIISARVIEKDGRIGAEFDHMAIIVYLDDQQWLVDVGFGDSFMSPKEFVVDKVQMDGNQYYKIIERHDGDFELQSSSDSFQYASQYIFGKKQRQFVEFIAMCQYHQSSPKSHFTQKKLLTMPTKDGRITMTDSKLVITKMGVREELPILNIDEFRVKLNDYFGVQVRKNY